MQQKSLESFQEELVKRVLKWPKPHFNTAAACSCSRCSHYEVQDLGEEARILERVMDRDADCLSGSVVLALSSDLDSLCLVRECRDLEESFGTCFTGMITSKEGCCLREMKKNIAAVDRRMLLEKCTRNLL